MCCYLASVSVSHPRGGKNNTLECSSGQYDIGLKWKVRAKKRSEVERKEIKIEKKSKRVITVVTHEEVEQGIFWVTVTVIQLKSESSKAYLSILCSMS